MPTTRTVLDLITASLQTLGVYAASETLTAEDAQLGLDTLQDMLAEWSDGGLMVPCTAMDTLPLVIGQEAYTLGENGTPDLNTVKPEQVVNAYVRDSANYDYSVAIIGEDAYKALYDKSGSAGRPDRLWVSYATPNVTVTVYPSPDTIENLYITSVRTFTEPTAYTENLMTTTQLPRNYFNALKWNLALELSTPFNREPTQLMVKRAVETKNYIKKLNMARTVEPVRIDIMGYSVRTGNILGGG